MFYSYFWKILFLEQRKKIIFFHPFADLFLHGGILKKYIIKSEGICQFPCGKIPGMDKTDKAGENRIAVAVYDKNAFPGEDGGYLPELPLIESRVGTGIGYGGIFCKKNRNFFIPLKKTVFGKFIILHAFKCSRKRNIYKNTSVNITIFLLFAAMVDFYSCITLQEKYIIPSIEKV